MGTDTLIHRFRAAGFSLRGFSPLDGLHRAFNPACENENHAGRRWKLTALSVTLSLICGTAIAGGFDCSIEAALPRVVKLYGLGAGIQAGYGTGVIVSEDGIVVTVLSLLIDAHTIRAVGADGTRYEAQVLYRDGKRQLALLQLLRPGEALTPVRKDSAPPSGVGPLPFFDLTAETALMPGDWVVAAGNPFKVATGSERMSIAHGVFSTRTYLDARRRVKDFPYRGEVLVIDAITSNPGGPGSALVNLDGEFVGMIGRVVVSNLSHTHLNYAVPREVLLDFYRRATSPSKKAGKPANAEDAVPTPVDPGIRMARTGYRTVLPFVERVQRDSPAMRAGLRRDDLILSINSRPVANLKEYDRRLSALRPGEPIDLVVRRGRAIRTIRIETKE